MVEQKVAKAPLLLQPSTAILKGPFARFENPVRRIARKVMAPIFRSGERMIEYNHLDESLTGLTGMLDENALLAIVTNHTSHSDVLVGIKLVRAVRSKFPRLGNSYIPVAASLVLGVQGLMPQLFYSEGTVPLFEETKLKPLSVVTENDQKKRNLVPTGIDLRRVIRAAQETDNVFLDFAEGSVESGRRDVFGNIKGMQKVTNKFLPIVFQTAHDRGKKVIVLPVGISDTNRLISADTIFLTGRAIVGFIQDWVFKRPPILARVNVGKPFEYSPNASGQSLTDTAQDVNDIVMASIASLKPLKERGHYHPVTRAYQQAVKDFEEQHKKMPRLVRSLLVRSHLLSIPDNLRQLAEDYSRLQEPLRQKSAA